MAMSTPAIETVAAYNFHVNPFASRVPVSAKSVLMPLCASWLFIKFKNIDG